MPNRAIEFHDSTLNGVSEKAQIWLFDSRRHKSTSLKANPALMQVSAGYKSFACTFQMLRSPERFLVYPVISGMARSHWTTSDLITAYPYRLTIEVVSRSTLNRTAN